MWTSMTLSSGVPRAGSRQTSRARISRGEDKNRNLAPHLPVGLQDVDAAAAPQHHIEQNEVELFGRRAKVAIFTGRRDDHAVMVRFESFRQRPRYFVLIFDD